MTPLSYWIGFHIAIACLMALEYWLHLCFPDARRKAIRALILWVVASLVLAALLVPRFHAVGSTQFLAGYAIEQALSVDNLLVFLLLFRIFRIRPEKQPRVLFFGIVGAMVMRGAFIAAGVGLLSHFHWVSFVFGGVLLVAAIRLLKPDEPEDSEKTPGWLAWLTRLHPVSESHEHFFVREHGQRMATVLFLSLVAVELTDVVFALDSIPAVLSITREPFIAYTSNIMAVMGLRSLYVLLAAMLGKLRYLHIGLAALLIFAALKMLVADWIDIGPLLSLAIIGAVLAITVVASLLHKQPVEAH